MNKYTLTVIVPVYDVKKEYLDECLNSIDVQSFRDYEVILVDDGAKGELPDYLDECARGRNNYRVLHQENQGVAMARNNAIDIAEGEYVTFIDSDDTVREDNFEKVIRKAQAQELEILFWGMNRCFPNKKVSFSPYLEDIDLFDDDRLREVQLKCMVGILPSFKAPASADAAGSACAKLYKMSFLKENGLRYVKGLKRAEDMLFNLMAFGRAKRVGYICENFYDYRQIESSATYQYRENGIAVFTDTLKAMREYLDRELVDHDFMQVYYMRCMFFLLESMDMDYNNPANPKNYRDRKKELSEVAMSEPYNEAIVKLSLTNPELAFSRKIPLVLIRFRMYGLLMLFYKIYGALRRASGK